MSISVVIPVYNEGVNVTETYKALSENFSDIEREFIFVNDGSTDGSTLEALIKLTSKKEVSVVRLDKNVGQQRALLEGFKFCSKKIIGVIDCDLQDPAADLRRLYKYALLYKEADVVFGERVNNSRRGIRSCMSLFYNKIVCKILRKERFLDISEFYCFRRGIRIESEYIRGELLKQKNVRFCPYTRQPRRNGRSKFGFFRLCRLAFIGIRHSMRVRKEGDSSC